jgi:phosphoheptose isomerase
VNSAGNAVIAGVAQQMAEVLNKGGKILFAATGSAADAQHLL